MQVDYFNFIAKGEFGNFKFGTFWSEVVNILGKPPLYEPASANTTTLARYDNLEFAIVDEKVVTISLQVDSAEIELPTFNIINFEDAMLDCDQVQEILQTHNLTWERIDIMCDDWIDYYRTSTGVHLSFEGGLLGKIGAANPDNIWGI